MQPSFGGDHHGGRQLQRKVLVRITYYYQKTNVNQFSRHKGQFHLVSNSLLLLLFFFSTGTKLINQRDDRAHLHMCDQAGYWQAQTCSYKWLGAWPLNGYAELSISSERGKKTEKANRR